MRVLLIEDEEKTSAFLAKGLREAGFAVERTSDGETGVELALATHPDLLIVDVMLPKKDGWAVVKELRSRGVHVPILFLTARDSVQDRVKGLELGADDYLVKPFERAELEARVRALIRRRSTPVAPQLAFGRLALDLVAREARVDGERVELTPREWAIMELFLTQPRVALAKERIMQSLSSWDEPLSANAVEVYVSRLRAKFESAGLHIRTVRGYGYMLEGDDAR